MTPTNTIYHQRPEIRYAEGGRFGRFLIDNVPVLSEKFWPTCWAATAIAQGVFSNIYRSKLPTLNYTRELLDCDDGGLVSLDWFNPSPSSHTNDSKPLPVALLFPGLDDDSQAAYLRHVVPELDKLGYRVGVFNNRGSGGMELRSPRLYCATYYQDYQSVIDHVRFQNPNSNIIAAGFSMGSIVLNRYLAVVGKRANIDAALLVSSLYDYPEAMQRLESNWLDRYLAKLGAQSSAKVILARQEILSQANKSVQWNKLATVESFRQLDEYFTCPMWDYQNPEEYYEDAATDRRLDEVQVPTLALSAADDISFSPTNRYLNELNEYVVLAVTSRGGHLGFMDGFFPRLPFYSDRLIEQFFLALRSNIRIGDLVD